MKCFLCNNNNLVTVYSLKTKVILHCLNDDLFFAQPNAPLTQLYNNDYYAINPHPSLLKLPKLMRGEFLPTLPWERKSRRSPDAPRDEGGLKTNEKYFLSKLKKIQQLTKETKPKILDIGCGWGDFLTVLKKKEIPYLGIDTSAASIEICRKQNLNCQLTDIDKLLKYNKEKFSAVTCFQVIEHLKNPIPFLTAVKKLLKKNGVILLTTPNNDSPVRFRQKHRWSVYNTDSHLVFYNQRNLTDVLKSAGFKKIKTTIDEPRFLSLGYLLSRADEIYLGGSLKFLNQVFKLLSIPVSTDPLGDLEEVGVTDII